MKHRTLGIVFIAVTLTGNAQQSQKAQPDDPQTQEGVAPNQQQIPGAQQDGAGPSQQQTGQFERRVSPPPNWNHNHEVYPNTEQLPDNGDPTIGKKALRQCAAAERGGKCHSCHQSERHKLRRPTLPVAHATRPRPAI